MGDPAARTRNLGTSVFTRISALARQHGAVNLGQGFPDFDGPAEIHAAAERAMRAGVNQYAISHGADPLRQAIAAHALRFHGQRVDPATEVTVTSGATEAIFDAVLACVGPGDEVVLFEPFYDAYLASVEMAGGVARFVRLHPPDGQHAAWWYADDELEEAFGPRTRLVIVNTPHNPTGKVFRREELERIGALCRTHDAVLLSDEVYEHLVYAPARHVRPATLPDLADRTITVSSAGKTFSLTGWKVGWAIASERWTAVLRGVHQFVTFATASPLQAAIAEALALPDAYFTGLATSYAEKRAQLVTLLEDVGFRAHPPEGSYFVVTELPPNNMPEQLYCERLIANAKVATIPLAPFYGRQGPWRGGHRPQLIRFAFCKRSETLTAAAEALRAWHGRRRSIG